MPSSSKAQQRFFGVVKAMQKGDKPKEGEAGKVAKSMKKKDVDKYAKTKHKGLPNKVRREMKVRKLIKKMVREIMMEDSLPNKVTDKYKKMKIDSPTDKKKFKQFIKHHMAHSGQHITGMESEPETYDFDDTDDSKPDVQKRKKDKIKKGYEPVTERKLNEKVQKYVVGLDNGEVISGDKAVSEKKAHQIMTRISDRSDGWVNPFMIGVEAWNGTHPKSKGKPHKMNKKKIMIKEGKLTEKSEYTDFISKQVDSLKGSIKYVQKALRQKDIKDWEKKEFTQALKGLKSKLRITTDHLKQVQKMDEGKLNEKFDLKKLEDAIKMFQKKIKKQGRVTNARDENHLKQLIKVYKDMGGRKIKESKLNEKSAISLNLWIKEFERLAKKNRMKPVDFVKKHISKRKGMDNEVVKNVLKHFQKNEGTCGYGENGQLGEEPAGPHLIKKKKIKEKKLNEAKPYETILKQLGGNRFIAMTGAKNLGTNGKDLSFSIGRNAKKVTHVHIKLTSMDLYDVEFINMRGAKRKVIKKVKGVYGDMLPKIFQKYTGMRTRL